MPKKMLHLRSFNIPGEIQDSLYWTPSIGTLASVGYGALPPRCGVKINDLWSGLSQTNDKCGESSGLPKRTETE